MSLSYPVSPYADTLGLIYFPRMLDKIRMHAEGKLSEDYVENLGTGFDGRLAAFLRVSYDAIVERTLAGGTDEEILRWCYESGREFDDCDLFIWNHFLRKIGWNDGVSDLLARRKAEIGQAENEGIQTMLEFIEWDEGRAVRGS